MPDSSASHRVVVVGGGITGLAAAHRVVEIGRAKSVDIDVTLLEARESLGGTIQTTEQDGFLIEAGPDSFITQKPAGLALCKRLGLEGELIPTNPACRRTLVVRRGRLYPVPEGFLLLAPTQIWPFVASGLFSWPGKLRMALDLILPRKDHGATGDESLASFVRRRFGREALERVAQPLVGGIYTADPETLSLRTTMPRFLDLETKYRSLIWGMRKSAAAAKPESGRADSGARYSLFISFARGMSTLVRKLAERLPQGAVLTNSPLASLSRSGEKWELETTSGKAEPADAVILACPAFVSAELLRPWDASLAHELSAIEYASAGTMSLAFPRDQVGDAMDGFGFVVPAKEQRSLIAVTYSSIKFPGRAPDGWVLMRAFFGGATSPEIMTLDDAELQRRIVQDLRELIGLKGKPRFAVTSRWMRSMPQYPVGHLDRVQRIQNHLAHWPGLAIAGNAFGGVGIPDCVASGEAAAEAVMRHLAPR